MSSTVAAKLFALITKLEFFAMVVYYRNNEIILTCEVVKSYTKVAWYSRDLSMFKGTLIKVAWYYSIDLSMMKRGTGLLTTSTALL